MQFNQLKESLYHNYYTDDSRSSKFYDVTSTPCRKFEEKATVTHGNEDFEINLKISFLETI
jgi:hypothetical protein